MAYNAADRPRAIEWLEQVRKWDSLKGHTLYLMPAFDCPPIPEIVPFVPLTDYLQVRSNWREADGVKHADAAGPNSAFRQVASHFYENKLGAYFWCEPDCCPLKPDCFDKLEAEYLSCGKPYLGGFAPAPVPHLNGNLIAPQHAALLPTLMLPMKSDDGTRDIAFDVAAAREILPAAHATNLIQHLWRGPSFTSQEDFDTRIRKDAVFYHQCRDGSIYKYLNGNGAKTPDFGHVLSDQQILSAAGKTKDWAGIDVSPFSALSDQGSNGSTLTLTERRQAQAAKMRETLAAKRATGWRPEKKKRKRKRVKKA